MSKSKLPLSQAQALAEKVAKHHNRNSRFRVRYYLCPDCGWYHLGRGVRPNIKPKRKVVIDE